MRGLAFAGQLSYSVPLHASTADRTGFRLSIEMRFLSSIRIVRVALALTVALWMAGAGCLLGCENITVVEASKEAMSPASPSQPANVSILVVSGDACAAMHSHDCCAGRAARSAAKSAAPSKSAANSNPATLVSSVVVGLGAPSPAMMDCPLSVNATAALSKASPDQLRGALPLTPPNSTPPHVQEHTMALTPPLVLPNRGHTYLRCCVFLI